VGELHGGGLIILLREIAVSGLREFLGGIQVSVPVETGQMENDVSDPVPWRADSGPGDALVAG
jgi:hypothetical protein